MSDFATLPVKTYRVVNDWLSKTLLETRDFNEACEAKAHHAALNQHDEIIVLAVIDVPFNAQVSRGETTPDETDAGSTSARPTS